MRTRGLRRATVYHQSHVLNERRSTTDGLIAHSEHRSGSLLDCQASEAAHGCVSIARHEPRPNFDSIRRYGDSCTDLEPVRRVIVRFTVPARFVDGACERRFWGPGLPKTEGGC